MSEKRFRVNDLVKYDYSEIGEYIDENHTDRPLRNDEVVDMLNEQEAIIQKEKGEKINAEEKLSYMIWKYNKLKQKNFDLQVKLSEVMENGD